MFVHSKLRLAHLYMRIWTENSVIYMCWLPGYGRVRLNHDVSLETVYNRVYREQKINEFLSVNCRLFHGHLTALSILHENRLLLQTLQTF